MSGTPITPRPDATRLVTMMYTNHRGERAKRTVEPKAIWFGSTLWHPEPQWLLYAYDLDRAAIRAFALSECEFR